MKIKMLKTTRGSSDGVTVEKFIKGQNYDVSNTLADVFVNQLQVAKVVKLETEIETPELAKTDKIEIPEKPLDIETPAKRKKISRKRTGK